MTEKTKAQALSASVGFLLSLGLFIGLAASLDGGPSATPGDWTVLVLIPFVILNPIFLLTPVLGSLTQGLPEWASWAATIVFYLFWWWFVGGVVARKLWRAQAWRRRTRCLHVTAARALRSAVREHLSMLLRSTRLPGGGR